MRSATPRAKFSFLIHDVSRMRRTFFDQALKPLGVTRAQWWALGNISRHAETGTIQTELAHILEIGKVSVGGLIDRLEEAGLVYRKNDPNDRRVKRIFITERGEEILDYIAVVGDQLDHLLFDDISNNELNVAADVMARVKNNVRKALKTPPLMLESIRPPEPSDERPRRARAVSSSSAGSTPAQQQKRGSAAR